MIPPRPAASSRHPTGLIARIETIIRGHWTTTSAPTSSHRQNYEIAAAEFEAALASLRPLLERDLPALHETLEAAGAPGHRAASCRSGNGDCTNHSTGRPCPGMARSRERR